MTQTDGRSTDEEIQPTGNVVELTGKPRPKPQEAVTDFVRDHPVLVVAGGVALGMLVKAVLA